MKWSRFFHQLAAEQGKVGLAALETKLEVEKLQVKSATSGPSLCFSGFGEPPLVHKSGPSLWFIELGDHLAKRLGSKMAGEGLLTLKPSFIFRDI